MYVLRFLSIGKRYFSNVHVVIHTSKQIHVLIWFLMTQHLPTTRTWRKYFYALRIKILCLLYGIENIYKIAREMLLIFLDNVEIFSHLVLTCIKFGFPSLRFLIIVINAVILYVFALRHASPTTDLMPGVCTSMVFSWECRFHVLSYERSFHWPAFVFVKLRCRERAKLQTAVLCQYAVCTRWLL